MLASRAQTRADVPAVFGRVCVRLKSRGKETVVKVDVERSFLVLTISPADFNFGDLQLPGACWAFENTACKRSHKRRVRSRSIQFKIITVECWVIKNTVLMALGVALMYGIALSEHAA